MKSLCSWSYLPGGLRSPMMCIVCMVLFTTWLLLTNSSVGSQLMIFDLGILESLQDMPDHPVTWLFNTLHITSSVLSISSLITCDWQQNTKFPPWSTLLDKWAAASRTWCVCPAVCVSRWPSFEPGMWGWIWSWSVIQWCAAFGIKTNKIRIKKHSQMGPAELAVWHCGTRRNLLVGGMEDSWCSGRDQCMWKSCYSVGPWLCSGPWFLCGTDGPEGSDMLPRSGTAPSHTGTKTGR